MLTLTLRSLERDTFVLRQYFTEVAPRAEYELTEMGGILRALKSGLRLDISTNARRHSFLQSALQGSDLEDAAFLQ